MTIRSCDYGGIERYGTRYIDSTLLEVRMYLIRFNPRQCYGTRIIVGATAWWRHAIGLSLCLGRPWDLLGPIEDVRKVGQGVRLERVNLGFEPYA